MRLSDLGAGLWHGRVLLPLARQGYHVTGVDTSSAMLEVARRKVADDLAGRVTLVQQDMCELGLGSRFNLAIVAHNSFVHLLTTNDQLTALRGIREHLKPGGLLLLDVAKPDLAALLEGGSRVRLLQSLIDPKPGHHLMLFCEWGTVDLAQQTFRFTYILDEVDEEGRVRRTFCPFSVRCVFRFELELLLLYAGFEVEAIYGSYDLTEYTSESARMIAVARRPRR